MKIFSVLILFIALSACGIIQKNTNQKPIEKVKEHPVEKPVTAVHVGQPELLDYAAGFIKLSPAQQKYELNEIVSAVQKDKSNVVYRIKLAAMYALPSSRVQDPSKALNLINELQKSNAISAENSQLLAVLRDFVIEQQQSLQKLKDEQKRADNIQQKNDQLLQQNIQLEQKLEALKRIEKTMVDRDQGVKK